MTLHFSWWKEGWEKTALLKRQPYLYFFPLCRDKPCAGLCGTSQNGSPWTDFSLGTVETHAFFCVFLVYVENLNHLGPLVFSSSVNIGGSYFSVNDLQTSLSRLSKQSRAPKCRLFPKGSLKAYANFCSKKVGSICCIP